MAKNFPKLKIDIQPQIQEAYKIPSRINTNTHTHTRTPRHIIFQLKKTKDKEKILNQRRKNILLVEEQILKLK